MTKKIALFFSFILALVCIMSVANAEVTVVSTYPANGAKDVDPNTKELRIRFSEPVCDSGWALVTTDKGESIQTDGKPSFAEGGMLCIWKIKLYPGMTYINSINSEKFQGFRSAKDPDVAVTPYLLSFTTSGTKPTGKAAEVTVLSTFPANGAKDVDPLTPKLKIRFSGPVRPGGYSFVTSDLGKEIPSDGNPSFSEGNALCELPVQLKPNTKYAVSINSEKFTGFRSAMNPDIAVAPYVLTFTTGKGEPADLLFRGPAGGSCGAIKSDLRFELIGPGNIVLYQLRGSGNFKVFGTVKVMQTGQVCKNGLIDKDGKVISSEK